MLKNNKKCLYWANMISEAISKYGELPYLDRIYKSYSIEKVRAYNKCADYCADYCKKLNKNFGGFNKLTCEISAMGIISANSFTFTFAAILHYWSESRDYSAIDYIVITRKNIYRF